MHHGFLQAAHDYRDKLSQTPDAVAFRNLWRQTNLPYAMAAADPYSDAYKDEVLGIFRGLTADNYHVGLEMTSTKQCDAEFQIGYPWQSRDLGVISVELAKTVQATRALHLANTTGPIVEFGAGWGNLALPLAKAGFDVTAVDMDAGLISRLQRLAQEQHTTLETFPGTFTDASNELNRRYDAIIFQSSFHHCLDFDKVLRNVTGSLLEDGGSIFFLSEPIDKELRFPWGIRYDGEALWAVMFNKWLELGFSEAFLVELLFRHGLVASRVPAIEGFVGDGWRATRAANGIRFADLILSPAYEEGFFPMVRDPAWGRFSRGRGCLPAYGMSSCSFTVRNFCPRPLKLAVRSGSHIETFSIGPGELRSLTIPVQNDDINICSETYVPDDLLSNGDRRTVGVAVTEISWVA